LKLSVAVFCRRHSPAEEHFYPPPCCHPSADNIS
jgi:hypothetical protein